MKIRAFLAIPAGALLALSLSGCKDNPKFNQLPPFIAGDIQTTSYRGDNDLLTAGLGASGLGSSTAPTFADALNPTADELRTLAIHTNYRALVDTVPGGGYGSLFGPAVDASDPEGRIPGEETLAFMRVPGSKVPVTVMVQVPDSFDPDAACMVTAPSSGSRGIYGAIGTAGEWGLKKGCAVVYTDKGTGTGSHNLETNAAQRIDGRLTTDANADVQFRADLSDVERAAFTGQYPDRFAYKHAHSEANPEADWGTHVLQSIQFGFYVLNQTFGEEFRNGKRLVTVTPDNTLVIASSVSNGGGASVRAAEQDRAGLIDGVAVSEPNVNPAVDRSFTIRQGSGPVITEHSRSLLDYTTAIAVYQGCANRAPALSTAPFNGVFNPAGIDQNICSALLAKNLVAGADLDAQATEALRILEEDFAIAPEQRPLAPIHFGLAVSQSISMTYANAYGRFGVEDRTCGLSLAATGAGGEVVPLSDAAEARLFSTSNGIPPSAGVNLVFDEAAGVATNLAVSTSPSSGLQDYGLDALLCLRGLAEGKDPVTGDALASPQDIERAQRIARGIEAVRASGDLQGKPAIFVTGRADAILPINHTSRPYFGLNQRKEGDASGLRYIEVLNAQHLDVLNGFPGFNERYIPLHHYYFQALDLVYDHLSNGTELPPSQVVRTVPRGPGAPALTLTNLPAIAADPAEADRIRFEDDQVRIPD
ncbi:MAG: 3-hydroxybutyrate oligomer hydrolase family protein [Marinobacter sp.]|uniref:3-hydroxybutyrate oligomer hydrolase family protein n=1 Tax=Marinobacter sp. TaxID=50741 RepID=UPI00299E698B|nr:3-hydroxybutyrate oligomer hydrolase family protein [Marinobacter sp.]MDX1634171.1 3-hydroxybutyrate oligomer hydrolase family protein [Marinobacter sp.]